LHFFSSFFDLLSIYFAPQGSNMPISFWLPLRIIGVLTVTFEYFAVIAISLLLMSLPIYGLLRFGIYIGAQRAVDNIVFGFMSAGKDHSEMLEEMKALKSAIKRRNCWYGLFGISKADWN
jgi:hypothetical protein